MITYWTILLKDLNRFLIKLLYNLETLLWEMFNISKMQLLQS